MAAIAGPKVIVTVNTGSSALRVASFAMHDGQPRRVAERHAANSAQFLEQVAEVLGEFAGRSVSVVCHRVVHGGPSLRAPALIDAAVRATIAQFIPLAPQHNPRALDGIAAAEATFGQSCRHVAVFDTGFFAAMPLVAATQALPRALAAQHALVRYGFHGLAHQSMLRDYGRWGEQTAERKIVSLQLGSGCSAVASVGGVPVDCSMGTTTLGGLMMSTRCGDIDAGAVLRLQEVLGDSARVRKVLSEESGLLGVSELSGDMRALLAADSPSARLAVDLFCRQVRKYVGGYAAVMSGIDTVLVGGGIGENSPEVRARTLQGMEWCGLQLDTARNAASKGGPGRISTDTSGVDVWVVPVDEASVMASAALPFVT